MAKILVIDDDTLVTQLLEEFLKSEGHSVSVSHTGEQGFQKALETTPELILQDVMLPDATGFQMVDRFRGEPSTSRVPIIMMSGAARHPNQKQLGNMMGANDYILKPFNIDDVDDRIKRLLNGEPLPAPEPAVSANITTLSNLEWSSSSVGTETTPPYNAAPAAARARPAFELNEWQKSERLAPAAAAVAKIKLQPPALWRSGFVFLAHLALSNYVLLQEDAPLRTLVFSARNIASGWAILLGVFVLVSALLRVVMETRTAVRLVGMAMIPLVIKNLIIVMGARSLLDLIPPLGQFSSSLDVFELTSLLIIGMMMRWQPGGSFKKSLFAILLLHVLWLGFGHHVLMPIAH